MIMETGAENFAFPQELFEASMQRTREEKKKALQFTYT
jgi:hypothetical protein